MKVPTLSEIDKIRRKGLRPEVVGCILYNKGLFPTTDFRQNIPVLPSACQKKFANTPHLRTFFNDALNKTEKFSSKTVIENNPKKLLFVYKKEHQLWQLPQGGINNNETIEEAIIREMTEELGIKFGKTLKIISTFGKGQIIFPPQSQGTRKIKSTNGKNIFMIGKKYFFVALKTNSSTIDIAQTDFDGYEWLDYSQALRIANSIYQKRKSELTIKIIQSLRKKDLL